MNRRRHWLREFVVLFALAAPFPALAQPSVHQPPDNHSAPTLEHLMRAGRWEEAVPLAFERAFGERTDTACERLRQCLRHALRDRRARGGSAPAVVSAPLARALDVYAEVLARFGESHHERERATAAVLFKAGIDEFDAALGSAAFRQRHVPAATADGRVEAFRRSLRESWAARVPRDAREARSLAGELVQAARFELGVESPGAVVLELVCGACAALDEYTAYLPRVAARAESAGPTVDGPRLVRDGVAYVRLSAFREDTPAELDDALSLVRTLGARALVLDLRGNPGGDFRAMVQVAERFLSEGPIVSTLGAGEEWTRNYLAVGGAGTVSLPLVAIVDRETASSAEILAAALRDNHRATLVGATTFGKGVLQAVLPLVSGSGRAGNAGGPYGAVRVSVARAFGPAGGPVSRVGVTPHVHESSPDRQLELAIEYAQRLAGSRPAGTP